MKSKAVSKKPTAPVSNAQKQEAADKLQQPGFTSNQIPQVQQVQQVPMQYPVQQQMQYPVQISMVQPGVTVQSVPNRIGYYGNRVSQARRVEEVPGIFNDDEKFLESVKEVGKEGKVEIELKAQRSQVKMGEVTVLPAMCSIVSSGGARTSVDLICVIDVSGSMSGEKIELVRETMKFLIETLTPSDRLSIITFSGSGNRVCGLKTVTQENLVLFSNHINSLFASGGTNIMSGMELALKTIRDRKVPNKVTSVFLLSDGQDKGAEESLRQALARPENSELGVFSIHSFGFGTDHD